MIYIFSDFENAFKNSKFISVNNNKFDTEKFGKEVLLSNINYNFTISRMFINDNPHVRLYRFHYQPLFSSWNILMGSIIIRDDMEIEIPDDKCFKITNIYQDDSITENILSVNPRHPIKILKSDSIIPLEYYDNMFFTGTVIRNLIMSDPSIPDKSKYQFIRIKGAQCLFIKERLTEDQIPIGLYLYEISETKMFGKKVAHATFYGSVISRYKFNLNGHDVEDLSDDESLVFPE